MTKKQVEQDDSSGGLSGFFKDIFSPGNSTAPQQQPLTTTTGGAITSTGSTAIAIGHSAHVSGHTFSSLSTEEERELTTLESELIMHTRHKKLERFKQLPSNIRQEVVDEAIFKDLQFKFAVSEILDDFPGLQRLNALRSKDWRNSIGGFHYNRMNDYHVSLKYPFITNVFSMEELMEAHAEATLEDEIAD